MGKARRARHLRSEPPALLQLPPRHERRRAGNSVYEVDSIPEPDPALNPHPNAWITRETLVASEAEGARDWDWKTGRYWKIVNPCEAQRARQPGGLQAHAQGRRPGDGPGGLVDLRPGALRAAQLVGDEVRSRGDVRRRRLPVPVARRAGPAEYIADDAPLENTDVVLWYTVGAHHVVRPEDWPVMPCAYIGFMLKPVGFFDGNPALDLPPSPPAACHHH